MANPNPIVEYCTGLMEAGNEDPGLIPNLAMRIFIRSCTTNTNTPMNQVNEDAIRKISDTLACQEFIPVFRPSDVRALVYLRDVKNWKGNALLIRVAGDNPLFRVTFDTLRRHNFSVYRGQLLYAGCHDPFGYVDGFGAHPYGYGMFVNNHPAPPPGEAYATGQAHGLNAFNTVVANFQPLGFNPKGVNDIPQMELDFMVKV